MNGNENCQHCYCGRCWINGVEHRVCCNCGHRMAVTTVPIVYPTYPYPIAWPYGVPPYWGTVTITCGADNTCQPSYEIVAVN